MLHAFERGEEITAFVHMWSGNSLQDLWVLQLVYYTSVRRVHFVAKKDIHSRPFCHLVPRIIHKHGLAKFVTSRQRKHSWQKWSKTWSCPGLSKDLAHLHPSLPPFAVHFVQYYHILNPFKDNFQISLWQNRIKL